MPLLMKRKRIDWGVLFMSSDILSGANRLEEMYFSPIRQVGERAAALAEQGQPVISFSSGEPDFNTPEPIKAATIQAIEHNKTHYAPNRGILSLRKAIAAQLRTVVGVEYDPVSEILLTAGGAEAINNAFLAVLNPGDEAIVFTPAFMNYENLISMCGATMVNIPLRKENGFQIDPQELAEHISSKTKLIILNNPCNPTGVVYTVETLEKVANLAKEHDLLVFSDEIYNQITYDGVSCPSIASFPGMKERTILMNGFSKAYAMTGWRLGYLAADSRMLSNLLKVHQYTTTCAPTFIQEGLAETMNAPETMAEVKQMVAAFDRRRKLLMQGLDAIGNLEYIKPQGAFYIFIDVSKTGMDGAEFARRLLEERYVACVPGSKLGGHCGNFVRISYATSDENIKEGLARIDEFLNKK